MVRHSHLATSSRGAQASHPRSFCLLSQYFPNLLPCIHIPDLNDLVAIGTLLDVDVDRKMGIHVSHLVLVSLRDTGDQVVDDRLDSSQGSDILSRTVVDFDTDSLQTILGLLLGQSEGDGNV